ncbi:MAG: M20/M25/M40 family metallo-hydrolase [Sulfurospirillaceae bacterium]|nr:M20/M25/M40 family metallo-hydrolase [Sulfurospirillaceae bacterium]
MLDTLNKLIDENKAQIYSDFEEIVNINSFSANPEGIDKVLEALVNIADTRDIKFEKIYSEKRERPHLIYDKERKKDFYAFIGHFDTVHPPHSDFQRLEDTGEFLKGPGTNDMKSGLIVALYSLYFLKKLYPKTDIPIKIIFNSDEEIGSLDSREIIETQFKNALAGFVFEPGRPNGEIVTARKAIATLDIEVIGLPAHAGVAPWEGKNAILASCEIIQKLEKLNDYPNGISVGCNVISSGVARNVVPAYSKIEVDVRFAKMSQKDPLFQSIEKILNEKNSVDAKVNYTLVLNRPPLEKSSESEKLYDLYREASLQLGYDCEELSTGGGSDGNFISGMGIPVIDGLGAVGNFSHTKKEYIKKESLLYRVKIFVLFMSKLLNLKE